MKNIPGSFFCCARAARNRVELKKKGEKLPQEVLVKWQTQADKCGDRDCLFNYYNIEEAISNPLNPDRAQACMAFSSSPLDGDAI